MGSTVDVVTPDGSFHAYRAASTVAQAPTVVVVQEAFGVNADLRATCDELARQGFNAVSPDLYWRQEPDLQLSAEVDWDRGIALYRALDIDKAVRDVQATVRRARPRSHQRAVGVMGFCLGGLLTYLVAARGGVDAGVCFYGGRTEEFLDEAAGLRGPLLMHLGSEDEFISPTAQTAIQHALRPKGVEIFVYPGCSHAFARHRGRHYDADAATLAMARTVEFLRKHLSPVGQAHDQSRE
jgi:carboxymethylenebutenolidase